MAAFFFLVVQIPVPTFHRNQLLMGTDLHHASVFHDHDLLGIANCRKPVRHHNLRTLILCDEFRHLPFGCGIQGAGSFVQHSNPWIPQQGGSNRDALTLTTREVLAPVGHNRVEPQR